MSNIRRVIETIFQVYDKQGDLVPFIFNNIQLEIDREVIEPIERYRKAHKLGVADQLPQEMQNQLRHSILKYRQGGVTTLIMAWFLVDCMAGYCVSVMLTHDKEHSERLLYRARLMLKNLKGPKPKFSKLNENEIAFEKTQSVFYIGTAGSKEFGRSATINNLHCCLRGSTLVPDESNRLRMLTEVGTKTKLNYSGPLTQIKVAKSPQMIECTPEHKILTQRGWVEAQDLTLNDSATYPVRKLTESLRHILGWSYKRTNRLHPGHIEKIDLLQIPLTTKFGRVLGLFYAEGSLKHNGVNFTLHEDETAYQQFLISWFQNQGQQILPTVGGSATPKIRRGKSKAVNLEVSSKAWGEVIEFYCYNDDQEKELPNWIFDAPREFLIGLLLGWVEGDGYAGPDRITITAKRLQHLMQLRDLIAALGWGWCSFYLQDSSFGGKYLGKIGQLLLMGDTMAAFYESRSVESPPTKVWLPIKKLTTIVVENEDLYDLVNQPESRYKTATCVVHNSEISFWKDPASLMKSLFQAIPKATGVIIQETTANGWGNWFQKSYYNYLSGRGGFSARFYPWYIHEEYFSDTPFQSELFTMDERKLEWSLAKVIYKALPGISKHEVRRKLQWRREKIDEAQGDRDRSAAYRDFQQEYPITYREAFIMTGGNLFGVVEVEASALWSYVGPGAYHLAHDLSRFFSYSLGADFAGGTGHDFSSIVVLCLELRCQVYAYRNNQINPVAFAEKICEVGRTYNALLVPEVNNHGLAGVAIIKRNYELAKIYKHILPQGFTNASMNIPSHGYGWKTTGQTKPYMVGIASQFLLSGWKVYCPILSDELMSFVEDPQTGKLEGAGDHDDSAIAFMLACLGILRLLKFAGTNLLDLETIPELPASVTEEPKSVTATLVSSPSWRDSNGTYQVAFTDMFKLKGRRSSHA
jgi:hypothetical protein